MGKEIERKFLVAGEGWRKMAKGVLYRQGYLCSEKERTVRVRAAGRKGYLTVKGLSVGAVRAEYEYEIPLRDAEDLLANLCAQPLVEKMRYRIKQGKLTWEIDEFLGANRGLVVAELELRSEAQVFDKPAWLGREVTGHPKYFNSNLARRPQGKRR